MERQLTELPWLLPRNDVVFKLIFGKHKDILQSFLEQVLDLDGEEYRGIKLIDTHQRTEPDSKLTILYLKIETGTGKLIDVEMQLLLLPSLVQRILCYLSQMLVGQIKPGQKYSSLKRVISILILDEEMFPQDNLLHHRFRFADQNAGFELTDLMEVHVLELPKARKKETIDSPLDAWLKFLAADRKEDFMQIAEHDPGVRSACMVLKDLSADEEMRLQAEMREKAWRDEMDRLDGAREKGREEGIGIGREQGIGIGREQGIGIGREQGIDIGKKSVAKNLLRMNIPIERIIEATGLTHEEISSL